MKVYRIKSRTANGRIAHTEVFTPEEGIIVIRRRILAKMEDLRGGWFNRHIPIYIFKEWVIMETELTL
jgi:hypothetical protein